MRTISTFAALVCLCLAGTATAFEIYNAWPFDADEAAQRQQETSASTQMPVELSVDLGDGVTLPLMLIPAGTSRIGAPTTEPGFEWDEQIRPARFVEPFYLAKYPLTRGQYKAIMGSYPEYSANQNVSDGGDSLPARVSCAQTRDGVIPALNLLLDEGMAAAIPIPERYEHATRAGTQTVWYTGSEESDLAEIGWYQGNSGGSIHPVGQKLPNPWGLYDMLGNVWTWVSSSPGTDGTALVKAGSFGSEAFGNGCRTANIMIQNVPSGVRLQVSLPPKALVGVHSQRESSGFAVAPRTTASTGLFGHSTSARAYTILGRRHSASMDRAPQFTVFVQTPAQLDPH